MFDIDLTPQSALSGAKQGVFGATSTNPIQLTALPAGILQLIAGNAAALQNLSDQGLAGADLRRLPPLQALLVRDQPYRADEIADLSARLGPAISVFDQSAGRTRLRLAGPNVVSLLAKGVAVDLHMSQFPALKSAATQFGHIGVLLTRIAADQFELLVSRSFSVSLWDELLHAGLEFGVSARVT